MKTNPVLAKEYVGRMSQVDRTPDERRKDCCMGIRKRGRHHEQARRSTRKPFEAPQGERDGGRYIAVVKGAGAHAIMFLRCVWNGSTKVGF